MNWSDGANFYLLKCVQTYGQNWKIVSSALSTTAKIFLKEDKGKDYSAKVIWIYFLKNKSRVAPFSINT